jgi:O-antigen/teichoic acid export membrane protein
MDSALELFLKRGAIVAAVRMVGLACVFGLQILLARLFGDSGEYGKYAWGQSLLFMTGTLAAMGIPVATSRFIASLSAQSREAEISRVIHKAQLLIMAPAGISLCAALALAPWWYESASDNFYRNMSALALLLAPIFAFATLYREISRARQWLILAFLPLQVLRPASMALLSFSVWLVSGHNLGSYQAVLLVGFSILGVLVPQIAIYYGRQNQLETASNTIGESQDYHPGKLFRTSLPIFLGRCAELTIKYSNILLVGFLAGPAAAGTYFAAERLAQLATIPRTVVSAVNQQPMAAAHATGEKTKLQMLATQSAHGSFWPTLAVVLVEILFGDKLLSLFGNDFSQAHLVLVILVLGNMASVFMGPAQDLLIMTGRQTLIPKVMLCTAAIHIILLIIMVNLMGATGAAITSITTSLISSVWLMILVRKKISVHTTVLANQRWRSSE